VPDTSSLNKDPDFIPEEEMKGQQTALQDPDFIPEDKVKKDPSLLQKGMKLIEEMNPNATAITKGAAKSFTSAVNSVADNPAMQTLDPITKGAMIINQTAQGVFDEGGEKTAERLAANGLNPYAAAAAGLGVAMFPDIVFTADGLAAMKAAGNAAAESKMINNILTKVKPAMLEYTPSLEAPLGEIPSGEPIQLEDQALNLLKGEKKPLALPAPDITEGAVKTRGPKGQFIKKQGFTMRDKPDLAKLQEPEAAIQRGAQPTYPEDIGNRSLKGYVSQRRLSSDVPDFKTLHETQAIAPADYNNPVVTDIADEARAQYSGVDSRIKIETDEMGRNKFSLKQDPPVELRTATEAEISSAQATNVSPVVKELGIDPRLVDSSPALVGSDKVPVMKPEVVAGSRSFIQSVWNRIGAQSEAVVQSMGQSGKALAHAIRNVRDVPQVRYGEFSADLDMFLKGMSRKQAKEVSIALTDVLEGRKPSTKLPNGLLEFVQQKLKVIADEAAQVGLNIRNSKGETVPFAPRENFFPQVIRREILDGLISGDNKTMSKVAKAMVDSRQEPNYAIAFERVKYMRGKIMLNKYGHLERAREFNLPPEFYDRNSLQVIPEYISSALHRIEEARQFGVEGEKALELISGIRDEGHDADLARRIFERFTRIEPRDTVILKGYQGLRNLAAGMLIQFQSSILQVGQVLTPAYEAGFVKAVKGFAKAFTSLGEAEAKRAGQIFTTAATDYIKESYGGGYGFAGKFTESMLNITGFSRMDHFLRKYSALVGKDYIGSLVTKLLKNNSSKEALVELQHLGFDTEKIIRNKGISSLEHNVGAKNFADMTQGAPDVTRLPYYWTSPEGKLFAQFKNFSYVIGKENASMIKRALQTGNVTRLGETSIGMPLSGYAIKKLRDSIIGESNSEITGQEDVDALIQVLANATAFGPAVDLFLLALQGENKLSSFFTPISVKNVAEIGGAAGRSLKEMDLEPFLKTMVKKTPVAGRFLANKIWGE
jgi:hypothetical protein